MNRQSIAIKCANGLSILAEHNPYPELFNDSAAELRRLHSVNAELLDALVWAMDVGRLSYSNRIVGQNEKHCDMVDKAKAAIAKAQG